MVSLNLIRDEFAKKLAIKPRGLSMDEFNDIVNMLLESISSEDEQLFARFDYWMRHEDRNAQIICANVELVRFGVLSARPSRKSEKSKSGNSDGYIPPSSEKSKKSDVKNSDTLRCPSLAQQDILNRFLKFNDIEIIVIKRLPETVESHAKLIDEWVSNQIDSKKRIDLLEQEDIIEDSNNGNQRTQSMSYISFEDLVRCISRSKNASSLRDYAMNLMAIFKIYSEELLTAKDNAIEQKDDKIDSLSKKIDELLTANKDLLTINKDQTVNIDKLLHHSEETNAKLSDMNTKLDIVIGFIIEFAKLILPAWVGSSVLRTRLDSLTQTYANKALDHVKLAFVVGLTDGETLKILFCCTNIANVPKRLKDIYNNRNTKYDMPTMLKPKAISLMNEDIGKELSILRRLGLDYQTRTKSLNIVLDDDANVNMEYNNTVSIIRDNRIQAYQEAMNAIHTDSKTSSALIDRVKTVDREFYMNTLSVAQEFLNCFTRRVARNVASYVFRTYNKKHHPRADVANMRLNDRDYAIHCIREFIETDDIDPMINQMVSDGVLTKDSISTLDAMAAAENIDTSHLVHP